MKGKVVAFIISGALVVVSVAILLIFFLSPNNNVAPPVTPLVCDTHDITLTVGDSESDFMEVSIEEAQIEFSTDKAGIITIQDGVITAIKAGSTTVTASVSYNEESVSSSFVVTVINKDYSITFSAISNCTIENNNLHLNGIATFSFTLFTPAGEVVKDPKVELKVPTTVVYTHNFGQYQLKASENCEIKLIFSEINFEATLNVFVS